MGARGENVRGERGLSPELYPSLLAPLRAAGIDVRIVGDCVSPRGVMAATAEGHEAGNAI